MRRQSGVSLVTLFFVPLAAMASVVLLARAQTTLARYSATAVDLTATGGRPLTTTVNVVITRWSTDAERDQLVTTLLEKGSDAALALLRSLPRAGSVAGVGSVGTDLHFARRAVEANKSERIVLVTDRPIGIWERRASGRSIDYPFTLIEMHLGSNGKGEGKASVATKISVDKDTKTIVLENYTDQPVALQNVVRQS